MVGRDDDDEPEDEGAEGGDDAAPAPWGEGVPLDSIIDSMEPGPDEVLELMADMDTARGLERLDLHWHVDVTDYGGRTTFHWEGEPGQTPAERERALLGWLDRIGWDDRDWGDLHVWCEDAFGYDEAG